MGSLAIYEASLTEKLSNGALTIPTTENIHIAIPVGLWVFVLRVEGFQPCVLFRC